MIERIENEDLIHQLQETFLFIHKQLKRGANEQAALAIKNLLDPHAKNVSDSIPVEKINTHTDDL